MLETSASFPGPAASRCGTAGQATVVLLLGAGMAYAGTVHAAEPSVPDPLDAGAVPAQAALARGDDAQPDNPVAAARGSMAGWKPVAREQLEEMRGGFDAGGLQVSFGIERAVYINGALVVATSLNIPDVGRITTDQAARLASTLGPSIVSAVQGATNSSVAAAAGAGASADGSAGSAGATATASAAGASSSSAGSPGASSLATGAAGASGSPVTTIATSTGQVITNGAMTIIQNGPGNTANVGALAGSAGTVIQNSLNNQSIRSVMTIDAGVNTLQAFRSQLANTALNSALLRAASMR
ncbi:flagellin [Cupriavidus sp. WKF15]|uniref:flagellin n=1 Tax=Cupriavidus sp. WKF15 TaxID=3032282 RepID=UPI0023E0F448|nr:flagellin [Cupriavidus sp. WKF15]WER49598.1 flagellin [Cupriavidus sp. WKF15]